MWTRFCSIVSGQAFSQGLNLMKFLMTCFVTVSMSATLFAAGPGSSGGGIGVVSLGGQVRFLDLLPSTEIESSSLANSAQINQLLYSKKKLVKQLGVLLPDFFNCSVARLSAFQNDFPVLRNLVEYLRRVDVVGVQFRLASMESGVAEINSIFPVAGSYSSRIPVELQETLAAFGKGKLLISLRVYERLSEIDRCGLAVHEALRELDFSDDLAIGLTTEDIEVATRYFMGFSFENDPIEQVMGKLKNKKESADELLELAQIEANRGNYEKSSQLITSSVQRVLDRPSGSKKYGTLGIMETITFIQGLTEKLGPGIYFNVSTMKYERRQEFGLPKK